jgi:hypothetical protein
VHVPFQLVIIGTLFLEVLLVFLVVRVRAVKIMLFGGILLLFFLAFLLLDVLSVRWVIRVAFGAWRRRP